MSDDLTLYERKIKFNTEKNDWKFNYNICKNRLIYDIIHGNPIADNQKDFQDLEKWINNNPDWIDILRSNDVALFPNALQEYKKTYITNKTNEFKIAIELNTRDGLNDLVTYNIQSYGVFLFDCTVGHKLFKKLRKHLNITYNDFVETYGESLYRDVNCLDDIIAELVVDGAIAGEKRNYKNENEWGV